MELIREIRKLRERIAREKREGKTIGFVPTMGYLHEGHLSLIRRAASESDLVVVSIFVNPIQFGEGEDLRQYPRDIERDLAMVEESGGDLVFAPADEEMYPDGYCSRVEVHDLTTRLCGKSRPGHFLGVTTIVAKLFNIVQPDLTVFGQKDAQQAVVIQRLIRDLNYPIQFILAPTIREEDMVAMSSRNEYLSPREREDAESLNQSLRLAQRMIREGNRNLDEILKTITRHIETRASTRIDYVEFVDPLTLEEVTDIKEGEEMLLAMAVFVGKTRLIDNALIRVGESF